MEGYWLTHFDTATRHGDGIAMLHAGELVGGDLEHLWNGTYEEEGNKVYARIRIVPCVSKPEEETMARERPVILSLHGYCTEQYARLEGHPDGHEGERFDVTMRKCRARNSQPAEKVA